LTLLGGVTCDAPRYCPAAALFAANAIWLICEAAFSVCWDEKGWEEYCE
jgi:hypothetical protein